MIDNYPTITVITVCFNAVDSIEETIKSVVNQEYENIEYIIIDGGSTDGTLDIIKYYAEGGKEFGKHINSVKYWISEPDEGIYDAMNKGVDLATGDFINFMNAGDTFVDKNTIKNAVSLFPENIEVIFGDSIEKDNNGSLFYKKCNPNANLIARTPTYRHGSSFIKTNVHKARKYDLSKKHVFGYGLDYNQIWNMHHDGISFQKIDLPIMIYEREGTSNNALKSREIIFRITHQNQKPKALERIRYSLGSIKLKIKDSIFGKFAKYGYYFLLYLMNHTIGMTPWWKLRRSWFKLMGVKISNSSILNMGQYFLQPRKLSIGNYTHINKGCILDARGGLSIGNNVSISYNVSLITGSHDCYKSNFPGKYLPIRIEDYVWIGANATILNNVTIGEGAVVSAGSVVTKNVEPYTIVGGVPAKKIAERPHNLNYVCEWGIPFF